MQDRDPDAVQPRGRTAGPMVWSRSPPPSVETGPPMSKWTLQFDDGKVEEEFWETYKTERATQIRASVSLFTFVTVLTVVIIPGHAFSLASTWLSVVLGRVLPVAAIIVSCVSTSNPLWKRYWPYTTSICMTAAVASVIAFLYHCATSEPSLESLGCKALMAGFMPVHPFAAVCMVSPLLTIGMAVRWDFAAAMVVVLDILLCALTLDKLTIQAEQVGLPIMLFLVSLVLIATSFVHERFARQLFVAREYQLVAKRSWRGALPEQEVDPARDDAGPGPVGRMHVGLKLPETLKGRTVGMSRSHSEEGGEGSADSRTFWDRAGRLDQMLLVTNMDGTIVYVSSQSAQLFNEQDGSLVGKDNQQYMHPADVSWYETKLHEAARKPMHDIVIDYRRPRVMTSPRDPTPSSSTGSSSPLYVSVRLRCRMVTRFGAPGLVVGWEEPLEASQRRAASNDRESAAPTHPSGGADTAMDDIVLASARKGGVDGGLWQGEQLQPLLHVAYNHLGNSLHVLAAATATLLEDFEEDFGSDQHDFLSSILQASHFAHVMIDDVIAMYQLKDQEYIVAPEVITLRPWLKDVVAGCRSGAKCAVKLVIPKESEAVRALPPAVLISKGPLQLFLENAVSIATRGASKQLRPVYIQVTSQSDNKLCFEVFDRGSGLETLDVGYLKDALLSGKTVKGHRAQDLALVYPLCAKLAATMGGSMGFDVAAPPGAGGGGGQEGAMVGRFWISVPFSMPAETEVAAARVLTKQMTTANRGMASEVGGSIEDEDEDDEEDKILVAVPQDYVVANGGATRPAARTAKTKPPSSASKPKKEKGLPGHGPLNMHVMFVDDELTMRKLGGRLLEQLGCTHQCLDDGDQVEPALQNATRPFDAILMDINMHRSDGAIVAHKLRNQYNASLPIIAITSSTQSRDVTRYYRLGIDVVLPKPFNLLGLGRALLEGKERRGQAAGRFTRQSAHLDVNRASGGVASGGVGSGIVTAGSAMDSAVGAIASQEGRPEGEDSSHNSRSPLLGKGGMGEVDLTAQDPADDPPTTPSRSSPGFHRRIVPRSSRGSVRRVVPTQAVQSLPGTPSLE